MKRRSTSRNFCVLLLANSLCVFLSNKSLSLLPKFILTALHLRSQQLFFSPGCVLCLPASLRGVLQTYLPSIEFA
jgi:hypothetical protein